MARAISKLQQTKNKQVVRVNKKQQVSRAPRPTRGDMMIRRNMLALRNPFHPDARGAKCMVFATENTTTLTVAVSYAKILSEAGQDRLLGFPNPNLIGWTPTSGSQNGLSSILGPAAVNPQSQAYGMNGAIWTSSDGNFSTNAYPGSTSILGNYRVVGAGMKLRSVLPTSQVQPRVTAITLPCIHNPLTWNNVVSNTVFTAPTTQTGVGQQFETWLERTMFGVEPSVSSSILGASTARDFTMYDILNDEAIIVFKPTSPAAFEFNDTIGGGGKSYNDFTNRNGDVIAASDVADYIVSGAPAVQVVGEMGDVQCDGWTGLWVDVRAPGVAAGATYMIVDHIYHLEGVPTSSMKTQPGIQSYHGPGLSVEQALRAARSVVDIVLPRLPTAVGQITNMMNALGIATNAPRRYRPMLGNGEL